MRKTMKTALLAATLLIPGGATIQAQDNVSQETGAVEMAPSAGYSGTTSTSTSSTGTAAPDAAPAVAAGALRVYGGMRVGVGGGFKTVKPSHNVILTSPATPGIQVGADYVLHKYFALGAETRLNWAGTRDGNERVMIWDLVVRPRSHYQLPSMPVELYGAVPVGLSVTNWPEDNATGKAGATLGLTGGANYFFTSHLAVNLEMGWLWHWVRNEIDPTGVFPKRKNTARVGQWTMLSANFLYAF